MKKQPWPLLAILASTGFIACAGSIDAADTETVGPADNDPAFPGRTGKTPNIPGASPSPVGGGPGAMMGLPPGPGMAAGGMSAATPSGPGGKVGGLPMSRLTQEQYLNTVRDLLGPDAATVSGLPSDVSGPSGFAGTGVVTGAEARSFMLAAESLGKLVATKNRDLVPCDNAKTGDEACAELFIKSFGRRVFRRSLEAVERDRLMTLYRAVRMEPLATHDLALGNVATALFQSPKFLYRWERGPRPLLPEQGLVRLYPDEVASRLSYFLWNTMPDSDLFSAVDNGGLSTPAGIEKEVSRMLKSPRLATTLSSFLGHLLEIDSLDDIAKNPTLFPKFNAILAKDMGEEVARFADGVIRTGDGTFSSLMLSATTFATKRLAAVYGVKTASDNFEAVELPSAERFGLLSKAAFLSTHATANNSHPIKRGRVVFERLLCGSLPPVPDDVPPPKAPSANLSVRQVFEMHAENPCAKSCHGFLDPPGFAFENYDAIGGFRVTDGGKPVDASGTLRTPGGTMLPFKNGKDLAQGLATHEEARRCFATQLGRYFLDRAEGADDRAWMDAAFQGFASKNYDIRGLLVAMTTSDAFRFRQPTTEEK